MTDKSPPAASLSENAATWRELAVARSLDSARSRAETRVQRFLDAALELMESSTDKEFTVQEVVERSGQSLRSFYQYFAGKHELLLALLEESIRSTAEYLRQQVETETDPLARLRRFVIDHYELCRIPAQGRRRKKSAPSPVLVEFAQQLLMEHPKEAARAHVPVMALMEELLADAEAAGQIRSDFRRSNIAGVVLQAVMFNTFASTISGTSIRPGDQGAEELWNLVFHGIGTDASS